MNSIRVRVVASARDKRVVEDTTWEINRRARARREKNPSRSSKSIRRRRWIAQNTRWVNGITRMQREIVEAYPQGRAASESAGRTTVQVSSDSESTGRSHGCKAIRVRGRKTRATATWGWTSNRCMAKVIALSLSFSIYIYIYKDYIYIYIYINLPALRSCARTRPYTCLRKLRIGMETGQFFGLTLTILKRLDCRFWSSFRHG